MNRYTRLLPIDYGDEKNNVTAWVGLQEAFIIDLIHVYSHFWEWMRG